MFKMRAAASVGGYRGPLVIQHAGAGLAKVHHRFEPENHAFPQPGAVSAGAEVRDLGLLVQLGPNAVSYELAHYAEAVGFHKFLDRRTYVANRVANPHLLDTFIQRGF